jgi:ketosteroid isomerase-like protein
MMDSQQAIRAARAAINEAIERRDPEGIAAYFLPEYHVVTARSHQRHGKEAAARSWATVFSHDAHSTHISTPEVIHAHDAWGMAAEHGQWSARLMAKQGPMEISGVYAAKWHLTATGWLLLAEIFTPMNVAHLPGHPLAPGD